MNRAKFFTAIRPLFGALGQPQVDGLTAILDGWDAWLPLNADLSPNTRWLAYELATTFHETGAKMVPVEEIGRGAGHTYGLLQANGQAYYGRGYVQLTWGDNYSTFGARLGVPLYDNPAMALEPNIAAQILFDGMAGGHFTGRRLGQYFGANPAKDDAVNARRIINGTDCAAKIAGYHKQFAAAIKAAGTGA